MRKPHQAAGASGVLKWYGSLTITLFRYVGSKQILSFRLPDLSLPSTSTKLLIHGVASCSGFSTPTCNILLTSCLKASFRLDRNWVTRGLLWCYTWIKLYVIWRTWKSSNHIKDIWVIAQNMLLACN